MNSQFEKYFKISIGLCLVLALTFSSKMVLAGWGCDPEDGEDVSEVCSVGEGGASEIARAKKIDPSCPSPTKKQGSQCVLKTDLILTVPLVLEPNTQLNCQGHRLLPSGTSTTGPNIFGVPNTQSVPPVAIFAAQATGVKVQNCLVGNQENPFSYGILLADSVVAQDGYPGELALLRNKILSNVVYASNIGIDLLQTDNSEVKDNVVVVFGNGFGVDIRRSKNNLVSHNEISRVDSLYRPKTLFPGGTPVNAPSVFSAGIILGTGPLAPPTFPNAFSFTVGDQTANISAWDITAIPPDSQNVIEGNNIQMSGLNGKPATWTTFSISTGIEIEDGSSGVQVRGNTVTGTVDNPPVLGMLVSGGTAGLGLHAYDIVIEENSISGAMIRDDIQLFLAHNPIVRNNFITGGGRSGVLVSSFALETAQVTHNIVSNTGLSCAPPFCTTSSAQLGGLVLSRGTTATNIASSFGAEVSLNDFTDNIRGVGVITTVAYPFDSELSVSGRGNYWGHNSPPGFLPTDSSLYPQVKDSNPYCMPVAGMDEALLPAICP